MDYTGTMMDAEDCYSEEEEDWTDTHWDSVPGRDDYNAVGFRLYGKHIDQQVMMSACLAIEIVSVCVCVCFMLVGGCKFVCVCVWYIAILVRVDLSI